MTRLLRAMTLAVTLSLVATISAGAASRAAVTRDQAATITIASDASLAAQATLQQGRVTVADYRIFESTDPSASLLSITGPTKHHRALPPFTWSCDNSPSNWRGSDTGWDARIRSSENCRKEIQPMKIGVVVLDLPLLARRAR